jgi:hypothetical protein
MYEEIRDKAQAASTSSVGGYSQVHIESDKVLSQEHIDYEMIQVTMSSKVRVPKSQIQITAWPGLLQDSSIP